MKKVIRLTESQLTDLIEKVIKSSKTINEKWKSDMTIEELDASIKKLKSQNDKYQEKGEKVPEKNRTKMSQLYFAKRAKKGWPGKGKSKA